MPHDTQTFGFVVRTTVTLLLGITAWRFMVVPTMNDRFRQRLFEIRRSLVLIVADGHLHYDEPAYRQLRNTINGLLRFAERITFARVLLSNRTMPQNIQAYVERTERALTQVKNDEGRAAIIAHRDQVDLAIARHIILISPWLWFPLIAVLVSTMSFQVAKSWVKKHRPTGIEAEAECFSDHSAYA